jgi:PKD repeat protein
MRVNEVIQFQIYANGAWEDFTSGILNIGIVRGCQNYRGPQSVVDVGQLQIQSRNPNLDPYVNNNVRYGTRIRILANNVRIYTGVIDGIDVQYRAKEDPIITITGIDMIGSMQKHILSTSFVQQDLTDWSTVELLQELAADQEVANFYNNAIVHDGTDNVNSSINQNITAWNAVASRVITDLGFIYADVNNNINYYRYPRTDPLHPNNSRPISASFDWTGSELSYKTINLNDGFENIVNQLDVTGEGGYWSTIGMTWTPYTSTQTTKVQTPSANLWGRSRDSLTLLNTNGTTITNITDAIFVEVANPVREVYEITFDASRYPEIANSIDLLDNININHLINQSTSIDRKYGIVGIKHDIGYDYWRITYIVKNWNIQETAMATPVISISPASGDQFTDFTFSYTIDPSETITSQYWTLGEGFTSSDPSVTVNYANPGVKNISLTVTNIYGWQKTVTQQLTVGASPPITSFTYSVISYNRYQFTFTGQEAASYSWNFGNGKTSTEQNPITYYTSASPVTVTLTATNAYGSATASQSLTPVVVTVLPIRYVKLLAYRTQDYTYQTPPYGIKELKIYDGATNVAQGKSLTVEERVGSFTSAPTYRDSYYRLVKEDNTLLSTYFLNGVTSQTVYHRCNLINQGHLSNWEQVNRVISGVTQTSRTIDDNSSELDNLPYIMTVDLGSEIFDFTGIEFIKDSTPILGRWRVLVSTTNTPSSTWYDAGIIVATGSTSLTTYTPTTTFPITTSWPTYSTTSNIQPTRYIKIVGNNTAHTLSNFYAGSGVLNFPTTGTGANNDDFWQLGSLYIPNETGASYKLGPSSCSVTVSNFGTYHAGDTLPGGALNDLTTYSNVSWTSTTTPVEIIMDLGTVHYNVGWLGFDTRNSSNVSTTTAANAFTIYLSEDGTTWESLDTLNMKTTGFATIYQRRIYNWQPSNFSQTYYGVPFTKTNRILVKP